MTVIKTKLLLLLYYIILAGLEYTNYPHLLDLESFTSGFEFFVVSNSSNYMNTGPNYGGGFTISSIDFNIFTSSDIQWDIS